MARFDEGEPLETVARRDWTAHGEGLYQRIASARLPEEDAAFFRSLKDRGLRAVVLGLNGCGDCERYLPTIAAIAREAGIEIRAFDREKNPDVMDFFLTEGKKRVPVFAVFEGEREVGRWIERPRAAQRVMEEMAAKRPPADAPNRAELVAAWRAELDRRLSEADVDRECVREIRDLLASRLAPARG